MNGVHDMGGMHGFGRIEAESDEPVFHAEWEGRCLALNRAMGFAGIWNIDEGRAAIENLPPHRYLAMSYYERWALRLQNLLTERGLVDDQEIAAGHASKPAGPLPRTLHPDDVEAVLSRGSYGRKATRPARFRPDDRVRARNMQPETHTRLPRYVRGRIGLVEAIRGCHVFPDSSATGQGEQPQWLYAVRFEGRELWGEQADPNLTVSIEAFEPYLEPA